jgi:hypothetical protein
MAAALNVTWGKKTTLLDDLRATFERPHLVYGILK